MRSREEAITAIAQHWQSLSNGCLTSSAVTDEGITASAQECHSLSNVWLTNAEVTDEGRTVVAQQWYSLSDALLTNTAVTDVGITALCSESALAVQRPFDQHGGHGCEHHGLGSELARWPSARLPPTRVFRQGL